MKTCTLMKNRPLKGDIWKDFGRPPVANALDAQKLSDDLRKTNAARDQYDEDILVWKMRPKSLTKNCEKSAARQRRYIERRQDLIDAEDA